MKNINPSPLPRVLVLTLGIVLLFGFSACSKRDDDQKKVDDAIEALASGETNKKIEKLSQDPSLVGQPAPESKKNEEILGNEPPAVDPTLDLELSPDCAKIPNLIDENSDEAADALVEAGHLAGECLRYEYLPAFLSDYAITFFKTVVQPEGTQLSTMKDTDLIAYLSGSILPPFLLTSELPPELQTTLRNRFSQPEIEELFALLQNRKNALGYVEARIAAVVKAKVETFKVLGKTDVRYALLLAMASTQGDAVGEETHKKITEILAGRNVKVSELPPSMMALLHPFYLTKLIPTEKPTKPELPESVLSPRMSNPIFMIIDEYGEYMAYSPETAKKIVDIYLQISLAEDLGMPVHEAPAAGAVKVVIADTGVDFFDLPELGVFLGNGKSGTPLSHDYSDGDANPLQLAVGGLAHGSGTYSTVLTILATHAPEVLKERQIEMNAWKLWSTRNILAGAPDFENSSWENRKLPVVEAILDQVYLPGDKPNIVSMSLGFGSELIFQRAKKPGVLLDSPWLWVMAAGNESVDVIGSRRSCFDDVPKERRPDARILCVGALVHPDPKADKQDGPQAQVAMIANYSNFGDRADVYAFESYDKLCPNGTSCATPAITGAAALLSAKFPTLTPEQIKEVIVEAAQEMTLEVEDAVLSAEKGGGPVKKQVRVFDPSTMIPQAIQVAEKKATSASVAVGHGSAE